MKRLCERIRVDARENPINGGQNSRHRTVITAIMAELCIIALRVSEEEETQRLDLSQHGEEGYYWEASA